MQELGASNSSYSIADQLKLNPALFPKPADFGHLRELVSTMRLDWGVLSIADVVFNHTAYNSPWLLVTLYLLLTVPSKHGAHG